MPGGKTTIPLFVAEPIKTWRLLSQEPDIRIGSAEYILKECFCDKCHRQYRATGQHEIRKTIMDAAAYQDKIPNPAECRDRDDDMQQQIWNISGNLDEMIGTENQLDEVSDSGVEIVIADRGQQ